MLQGIHSMAFCSKKNVMHLTINWHYRMKKLIKCYDFVFQEIRVWLEAELNKKLHVKISLWYFYRMLQMYFFSQHSRNWRAYKLPLNVLNFWFIIISLIHLYWILVLIILLCIYTSTLFSIMIQRCIYL